MGLKNNVGHGTKKDYGYMNGFLGPKQLFKPQILECCLNLCLCNVPKEEGRVTP